MGLAALYTAALVTSAQKDSMQAHISMQSCSTAYEVMPLMLASLLKQQGWQDAGIVRTLVEALYSLCAHKKCDEQSKSIISKCLLAVHSDMTAAEVQRLCTFIDRQYGL